MNEKRSNQFIGIILLALGAVMAISSIFHFGTVLFFRGWWTLLIIVPSVVSIIKNGFNKKNGTGLIAGGVLLLNARTHFLGAIVGKLFIPIILLAFGIRMLTKDNVSNH